MDVFESLLKILKEMAVESLDDANWEKLKAISAIALTIQSLKAAEGEK